MPVLAAVVHLCTDPAERLRGLAALGRIPGLSLGELVAGDRLPVVLESADRFEDKDRWAQVSDAPGIVHVELVLADFSDLTSSSPGDPAATVEPS